MLVVLFSLCTVLLLKPLQYGAMFSGITYGNLEISWRFNISLYLDKFGEEILYAADYKRNVLILAAYKEDGTRRNGLRIKYNNASAAGNLLSTCGCDPCDERLMNFYIFSFGNKINVKCNNRGSLQVTKINVLNRFEVVMSEQIKDVTNIKHLVYIAFLSVTKGCLHSFYHNFRILRFDKSQSDFLSSCPRLCPSGMCNKGKCRLFSTFGPPCDCSSTVLNGPYCNNDLRLYTRESNNSFEIVQGASNIYLKYSWRRLLNKRYCLLQFIHGEFYETFSIHNSDIMSDIVILGDINGDGLNFLTLTWSNKTLVIKVNGESVYTNRIYLEGSRVNVGFSDKAGKCETFEGTYDLQLGDSGFKIIQTRKKSIGVSTMDWRFICVIALATIVVIIIVIILVMGTRKKRQTRSEADGNVYEAVYRGQTVKDNTALKADEYDMVDPNNVYASLGDKKKRKKHISFEGNLPELPPRNL